MSLGLDQVDQSVDPQLETPNGVRCSASRVPAVNFSVGRQFDPANGGRQFVSNEGSDVS
jgi:hypothetical protein